MAKTKIPGRYLEGGQTKVATANQSLTAAARTYITGSNIVVPDDGWAVGDVINWSMHITKTAAGTAASTYDICFGSTGTTSDVARVSFTKPAGTAVIDEGWIDIQMVIRSVGASGTAMGTFRMVHNLSATGHATIPIVVVNTLSGAFDTTTAGGMFGICATTGASDVITVKMVTASAFNF